MTIMKKEEQKETNNKQRPIALSHYEILQVSSTAEESDIKQAYHRAARQCHPDKKHYKGSSQRFRQIQAAWECLRDPESRRHYDSDLMAQRVKSNNRLKSAVVLYRQDCRELAVEDDYELIYTCRCGEEIPTAEADDANNNLIECPGCSLLYDTTPLWEQGDDEPKDGE